MSSFCDFTNLVCPRCGYDIRRIGGQPDWVHACRVPGVGGHFSAMASQLAIDPKPGCGCQKLAREMDQLAPDGCRREFDRLKAAISENYNSLSWGEKQLAKLKAAATGLAWKLDDWNDPVGSILRLAIERAEESQILEENEC